MEKKITIREICLVGLMAAAVYVASEFLQIPIPTAIDNTRLHMGMLCACWAGFFWDLSGVGPKRSPPNRHITFPI